MLIIDQSLTNKLVNLSRTADDFEETNTISAKIVKIAAATVVTTTTKHNRVHHANFNWPEEYAAMNEYSARKANHHRYVELSPQIPFGMMLIISTIIFILIIFRRWPGLVAGIVAGCLTSISIYLLLLTLKEQKLVYE